MRLFMMRGLVMNRCRPIGAIVAYAAALVVSGCQAPGSAPSPTSLERDRDAVVKAHEALVDGYERGDVAAFVRVLDPSADLLVIHPRLEERFDGIDEVRREIPRMFERLGGAQWSDYHVVVSVHGDVAWLTSHVLVESRNVPDPFLGRGTEIYIRRPDGWKLIHGHWSSAPPS